MSKRMRLLDRGQADVAVVARPINRADHRRAARAGSRDGRRGVLFPSVDAGEPGRVLPATSEFLRGECAGSREFISRRLHLLLDSHRDLVGEIFLRSRLLVQAYDEEGKRDTTYRPRLKETLAAWSTLVNAERLHLEADVEYRNRLIEIYWSAVRGTHYLVRVLVERQREAARAGTPIPVGLEVEWPGGVQSIDLAAWQPVRVPADLRHITPVDTLRDSLRVGIPVDVYGYGALPRALEIINHA